MSVCIPNSNKSFFKQDWLPTKKMLFFFFLLGGIFCPADQKEEETLKSCRAPMSTQRYFRFEKGRKVENPKRSKNRKGLATEKVKSSKGQNGQNSEMVINSWVGKFKCFFPNYSCFVPSCTAKLLFFCERKPVVLNLLDGPD